MTQVVKLKAFSKFENTTEALAGAAALTDSKLSKGLKKFLKKNAAADELAVLDAKLGGIIKEKLGIQCIWRSSPAPRHRMFVHEACHRSAGCNLLKPHARQLAPIQQFSFSKHAQGSVVVCC